MSAHRYVWLTCDGQEFIDGEPTGDRCLADTFYDVIPGITTILQAERRPSAHRWHRIQGGGHLCPECWASGQRKAFTPASRRTAR